MKKKNKKPTKKYARTSATKPVKTLEILRIDWFDHFTGNRSWMFEGDLKTDLPICTTIGMKVAEDEKTITLAQNASTFEHISDTTTIIKSCIDDVVKLGEVRYVQKG